MPVEVVIATVSANPWLSIWFHPRETIRQLLANESREQVLILAVLYGVGSLFQKTATLAISKGYQLHYILVGCFIVGALLGVFQLYIYSWLLRWTGSLIQGRATAEQVRVVYAWSLVPSVCAVLLWMMVYTSFVLILHSGHSTGVPIAKVLRSVAWVPLAAWIWSLMILANGLAEAHQFSLGKGYRALFLGILITTAAILILAGFLTPLIAKLRHH